MNLLMEYYLLLICFKRLFVLLLILLLRPIVSNIYLFFYLSLGTFEKRAPALSREAIRTIKNGNWTEWSAILSEIIRVIWNHKYDFNQNRTTRSSIITLLKPFWNRTIKFIHFVLTTKVAKCGFYFHFPAMWLVSSKKP